MDHTCWHPQTLLRPVHHGYTAKFPANILPLNNSMFSKTPQTLKFYSHMPHQNKSEFKVSNEDATATLDTITTQNKSQLRHIIFKMPIDIVLPDSPSQPQQQHNALQMPRSALKIINSQDHTTRSPLPKTTTYQHQPQEPSMRSYPSKSLPQLL